MELRVLREWSMSARPKHEVNKGTGLLGGQCSFFLLGGLLAGLVVGPMAFISYPWQTWICALSCFLPASVVFSRMSASEALSAASNRANVIRQQEVQSRTEVAPNNEIMSVSLHSKVSDSELL